MQTLVPRSVTRVLLFIACTLPISVMAVSNDVNTASATTVAPSRAPSTGTPKPVPNASITLTCGSGSSKRIYTLKSGPGNSICSLNSDRSGASCSGDSGTSFADCGSGCTTATGAGSCSVSTH